MVLVLLSCCTSASALRYPALKSLAQAVIAQTPMVPAPCPADIKRINPKFDAYCGTTPNNLPFGLISHPIPDYLMTKGFRFLSNPESIWVSSEDGTHYSYSSCNTQTCSKTEIGVIYFPINAYNPVGRLAVFVQQN